jgi:hypothetical protein
VTTSHNGEQKGCVQHLECNLSLKEFQLLEVQILCTSNQKTKPDVNLELLELCTPQVAREPLLEDEFVNHLHKFNPIDLTLHTSCC